jgi:Sec-independent protein secretion pathway component TatC
MISINKNRLHKRRTSNSTILVLMALSFLLSFTITITIFSLFDHVQVPTAAAQQENNNNSNNTKFVSTSLLSTISTAIGTGAAATGAIVTVPGFLRARKQPKFLAIYLRSIMNMTDFVKKQNL